MRQDHALRGPLPRRALPSAAPPPPRASCAALRQSRGFSPGARGANLAQPCRARALAAPAGAVVPCARQCRGWVRACTGRARARRAAVRLAGETPRGKGAHPSLPFLFQIHLYHVVGRHLPTEKDPSPKIYRMKVFAPNTVRASARAPRPAREDV